jgi:hypothetical protein
VLYRGCAIPIAWVVLPATKKGAWRPHWETLFTLLKDSIPPDWTVIVLADRGVYAGWLFHHIQTLHWHPFLRSNQGGNYRRRGAVRFRPLAQALRQGAAGWSGAVTCFSSAGSQLECTLLAHWDTGHTDPWLIVTDLAPEAADVAWYGLRPMIECGFKEAKRGGWHWEQTKMTDPERARRLWLAIAVARLWVVSVGGAAEESGCVSMVDELPALAEVTRGPTRRSRARLISCFGRGVLLIVATLIASDALPASSFVPEPWPKTLDIFPYPVHHSRALQKAA